MTAPAAVKVDRYRFALVVPAGATRTIGQRFELAGKLGSLSVPGAVAGVDVVGRKLRSAAGVPSPVPLSGETPVEAGEQLELVVTNSLGSDEFFEAFVPFTAS